MLKASKLINILIKHIDKHGDGDVDFFLSTKQPIKPHWPLSYKNSRAMEAMFGYKGPVGITIHLVKGKRSYKNKSK